MLADIDGVVPIDDPHLGHHLGVWRPIPLAWAEAGADQPELEILTSLKRDKPSFFFSDRYRRAWAPPLRDLITSRFQAQADDALSGRHGPLESGRPMVVVKEPGSQAADLLVS